MYDSSEKIENLLGALPRLDSQAYPSLLTREYSPRDVLLSLTPANLLVALHRARQAREFAVSYRGFNVGAALMAFKFSPAHTQIVTGVNIKPEQDSTINIHAEQSAIRKVARVGFDAVSIIAVVGETQNDQQSGHEMCTLHPCGLCRTALGNSPLVDNDRTLIATALPDLRTIELSTVSHLEHYHNDGQFNEIVTLEVPDLELLRPFEATGPVRLEDTDEQLEEDHSWHALVDPYLMPLRLAPIHQDETVA